MCDQLLSMRLSDLFPGVQMDRQGDDELHATHCCLVAIGRLQVIIVIVLSKSFITILFIIK